MLQTSDYFDIDTELGVVNTWARIDRESICTAGVEECTLSLDIMVSYKQEYIIVKLHVSELVQYIHICRV